MTLTCLNIRNFLPSGTVVFISKMATYVKNWKCRLKQKVFQASCASRCVTVAGDTREVSVCSQGLVFFRNQTTISGLVFQSLEIRADQLHIAHKPPALTLRSKGTEGGDTTDLDIKSSAPFLKVSCDYCQCSE